MASIAPGYANSGISIGRIISRGFGIIAANPVASLVIGVIFGGVQTTMRPWAEGLTGGRFSPVSLVLFFVALIGSTATYALSYGVFAPAAVAYSQGRRVEGGVWASAVARALPLLVVLSVIYTVSVFIGFILLIVPGLFVSIMWLVAGPALIAERGGVFHAIGRSRYLTKGARWHIVGLELVVTVMLWLVNSVYTTGRIAIGGVGSLIHSGSFGPGMITLSVVTSAVIAVISAAINSALYIDLRDWKDGADPGKLAEIFS